MTDTPPAPAAAAAQPGTSADPLRAYNFKLIIQDVVEGHFTAVDGLGVSVDRILYREAGDNTVVRSIPGRTEYPEITLRYGLTTSRDLFDWMMKSAAGQVQRRDISIAMLDAAGATEVLRWNLTAAWPMQWRGAPLDAMSSQIAIETITLAIEGLELDNATSAPPAPAPATPGV